MICGIFQVRSEQAKEYCIDGGVNTSKLNLFRCQEGVDISEAQNFHFLSSHQVRGGQSRSQCWVSAWEEDATVANLQIATCHMEGWDQYFQYNKVSCPLSFKYPVTPDPFRQHTRSAAKTFAWTSTTKNQISSTIPS